jgi:hypothetical protein
MRSLVGALARWLAHQLRDEAASAKEPSASITIFSSGSRKS